MSSVPPPIPSRTLLHHFQFKSNMRSICTQSSDDRRMLGIWLLVMMTPAGAGCPPTMSLVLQMPFDCSGADVVRLRSMGLLFCLFEPSFFLIRFHRYMSSYRSLPLFDTTLWVLFVFRGLFVLLMPVRQYISLYFQMLLSRRVCG